jgi:hypothetical protein
MHSLSVIREVALDAVDDSEEDNPEALTTFHEIADPRTVLELIELAETSLASDQMEVLKELMRDMATYIEKVPEVNDAASPLKKNELLARFGKLRKALG